MVLLSDYLATEVILAVATILFLIYFYLTATYGYWKKRGVPYVKPLLLFGNVKDQFLQKKPFVFVLDDIYKNLKGEKFGGYFQVRTPMLMMRDPQLIQRILIKDFSQFTDRDFGIEVDFKTDPLSGNLFNLKGHIWKNLRNKLTPTFTTGKLRGMFEQMCNCGDLTLEEIDDIVSRGEAVDAKKLGSTFAIDVISSVSFGLQFKPNSAEGKKFREVVNSVFGPSRLTLFRFFCLQSFGKYAKFVGIKQFPSHVTDYIVNLVKSTIGFRGKNNISRNDFLQLMIDLQTQEQEGKEINWKSEITEEDAYLNHIDYSSKDELQQNGLKMITDECIAAQAFVFLTGGSEAASNAINYTLYELALNPNVQRRLQEEIDTVLCKHGGRLTYEALKEMNYLDLVVQERNRKYSEGQFLVRVCNSPYLIPDTNVVLEKGTKVVIPIYSIHNDPAFYPEPDKFIPERFEGNNHHSSGTYLPFGDGPRICIAMRFVILELKVCIAKIMSRYSVSLDPRTKVPLEFDPRSFVFIAKGGIWVKFQKRQ